MTVHVHLERVVVDGPLPMAPHLWRAALVREVTAALEAQGVLSGQSFAGADLRLAALPTSHVTVPQSAAGTASPGVVGAAVGAALVRATGGPS